MSMMGQLCRLKNLRIQILESEKSSPNNLLHSLHDWIPPLEASKSLAQLAVFNCGRAGTSVSAIQLADLVAALPQLRSCKFASLRFDALTPLTQLRQLSDLSLLYCEG